MSFFIWEEIEKLIFDLTEENYQETKKYIVESNLVNNSFQLDELTNLILLATKQRPFQIIPLLNLLSSINKKFPTIACSRLSPTHLLIAVQNDLLSLTIISQ